MRETWLNMTYAYFNRKKGKKSEVLGMLGAVIFVVSRQRSSDRTRPTQSPIPSLR